MSDKLEALKAKKPADTKSLKSQAAGYVTDDNTGGYYVVECQECGAIYPSQQSAGGSQIADTGDYNDSYCPHCGHVDPDECDNVCLVWNVQQAKINALLAALEEANSKNYLTDMLEWRKKAQAAEKELGQWRDVATAAAQDDADWRKLVNTKNHAIYQLANAVIAQINKTEAAGRREEHLKADVAVMGKRIAELEQRPAPTVSFYRDGIIAAAKWIDGQREAFDSENGRHDPDTGTFEFGNSAQEEHSSTLQDIADGIRALHPQAEQQPIKLPELDSDLIDILGRPNFACIRIAKRLRELGYEIKRRSENEQAATLHFLLSHYLADGGNWRDTAEIALRGNADKVEGE